MTREEAIRIIDPKTTCDALSEIEYFGGFSGEWARSIALCEALSMAAAALREQEEQRWIPTTERMPKEDGKYLCVWQRRSIETGLFLNGHFRLYGENKDYLVSHWMALPALPKEV